MFHFSSNRKATKSALMQDEKLCRHNQVISSQARYISEIRISVANIEVKDRTTRNNAINLWLNHNLMNKIHKTMTHLGKNHYTPNASTKSIILLHNNGDLHYILQWGIYKKSSPQFMLRVRDILHAIKCF